MVERREPFSRGGLELGKPVTEGDSSMPPVGLSATTGQFP